MNGKLKSPLMVVLKEPRGLGPRINLPNLLNLYIKWSNNGNINKQIVSEFVNNVLNSNFDRECALLIDGCKTQTDENLYKLNNKTIHLRIFPDNSTSFLQPLDCYGFRQWKNFVKKFTEFVSFFN